MKRMCKSDGSNSGKLRFNITMASDVRRMAKVLQKKKRRTFSALLESLIDEEAKRLKQAA